MADFPDFPYEFWIMPQDKDHGFRIKEWCIQNFGPQTEENCLDCRWLLTRDTWTIIMMLQNEEDAVLFKLTWC